MPGPRSDVPAVFVGGFAGAVARAEVAVALPPPAAGWPWGTFLVNLGGAFLLGIVLSPGSHRWRARRSLLGTGFCGGLTTFSTLELELLRMLDAGHVGLALLYVVASVACGLAAVAAGAHLVGRAAGRR